MGILIFPQTLKRKEVGNGFWKNVNYWKILWCNIIFRIPIPEELCQNKKNFSGFFFFLFLPFRRIGSTKLIIYNYREIYDEVFTISRVLRFFFFFSCSDHSPLQANAIRKKISCSIYTFTCSENMCKS